MNPYTPGGARPESARLSKYAHAVLLGKGKQIAAIGEGPYLFKQCQGLPGQWHQMLTARFHALRRYPPLGAFQVNLAPFRPAQFRSAKEDIWRKAAGNACRFHPAVFAFLKGRKQSAGLFFGHLLIKVPPDRGNGDGAPIFGDFINDARIVEHLHEVGVFQNIADEVASSFGGLVLAVFHQGEQGGIYSAMVSVLTGLLSSAGYKWLCSRSRWRFR